jgi:hypothetical protein
MLRKSQIDEWGTSDRAGSGPRRVPKRGGPIGAVEDEVSTKEESDGG